jgi:hypothetical protein
VLRGSSGLNCTRTRFRWRKGMERANARVTTRALECGDDERDDGGRRDEGARMGNEGILY